MNRLILLAALLLSGCANPYSQFYKGPPDARLRPGYVAPTEELKIYTTNDFPRDLKALMRRGYVAVGESSFNAGTGAVTEAQLREHAQKIGEEKIGSDTIICYINAIII